VSRPHRIAGGAIVVHDGAVLLVRYRDSAGSTYLAAPGGGALEHESVAEAAVRETLEETGVLVSPGRVLLIEDILASQFKCCKVWLACTVVRGDPMLTDDARREGICEVGWFRRPQLTHERVYPWILQAHDWSAFTTAAYTAPVSPSRHATF
jgi:8-oxo-dGTP pyrophosphatase MutT (NUDIX family)